MSFLSVYDIADANFPSSSIASHLKAGNSPSVSRLVQLPGTSGTDVLKAIVQLMPIDTYVHAPVSSHVNILLRSLISVCSTLFEPPDVHSGFSYMICIYI